MSNNKPLKGSAFCCTGIPSKIREEIAHKTVKLGGKHYSDLMSDVDYLVVGNRNTDKYNYCIKNRYDIKFLKADAIQDMYDKWIKGEDIDINDYVLPIFGEISVCLSRIETVKIMELFEGSFREGYDYKTFFTLENLVKLIKENGGKVTESLTISNSCVITTETKGKRYSKAVEWKIPVMHPIWIFDSYLRLASLKFEDYLIELNEFNGCNVWNEWLQKRDRQAQGKIEVREQETSELKLKLKRNTEIWNSIMGHAKDQTKKLIKDSTWDELSEEDEQEELPPEKIKSNKPDKNLLFHGLNFLLLGFTQHQISLISNVIGNNSGEISKDLSDETITHIILPVENGSQSSMILKILPSSIKQKITNGETKVVTEWFIERSIYYNRIIIDRWGQPIKGLVKSSKRFKVCISGFTGIELLHIEKLIKYLNLEYCETLTKNRDLLVININLFKDTLIKNSPILFKYKHFDILDCPVYKSGNSSVSTISSKNKINAAKKWNIPVVSISYLWESMESSNNKSSLTMPSILDYAWCLYAPSSLSKPTNLMEYIKNISGNNFETPKKRRSEDEEEAISLPSPRKCNNKKQKYGRLSGTSSPESLTTKLSKAEQDETNAVAENEADKSHENDVTNIEEEELLTQVGYEDAQSMKNKEQLLKKLGGQEEGHRKRGRRRKKVH